MNHQFPDFSRFFDKQIDLRVELYIFVFYSQIRMGMIGMIFLGDYISN